MRAHALALALAVTTACTLPHRSEAAPLARSGPYTLQVVDEAGRPLPTFQHRGRTYVLGSLRQRYLLRIRNESGRRIEVVASVDGLDVVDGRPAGFEKRGYLVEAGGELTIDGFRLSEEAVAAFRFSSVPRSYAARQGDARDVGVIGAAIFPERVEPAWALRDGPNGLRAEDAAPAPGAAPAPEAPSMTGSKPGRAPPSGEASAAGRPGLGTEFGEQHGSRIHTVEFERASAAPEAVIAVRYDDRAGLVRAGVDVDGARVCEDARLRENADPFRRNVTFSVPPPGWRP
jgi:hypothetical protein